MVMDGKDVIFTDVTLFNDRVASFVEYTSAME